MTHRADWLHGRWGVCAHYLAEVMLESATPQSWNATVSAFDVEGLARQLEYIGANHLIFTVGQTHGYYCAPNATYDAIVNRQPSRCSSRDLIADLGAALNARGIRLIAYLPSDAPWNDAQATSALEFHPGAHRNAVFLRHWEAVLREWSLRWGDAVSGWFFDGVYQAEAMFLPVEPPNFASFAAAARVGNPHAAVSFSPGVHNPIISLTAEEDFTAGVTEDLAALEVLPSSHVGEAQLHVLSFLGPWWGKAGQPRFSRAELRSLSGKVRRVGGAITWDVPLTVAGRLPDNFAALLEEVTTALSP